MPLIVFVMDAVHFGLAREIFQRFQSRSEELKKFG
jgi:hypothetical protein